MSEADERVERAHAIALQQGAAGYIDPDTGLFVMTAKGLRDRGKCCGNGCRHCPYGESFTKKTVNV